MNTQRAISFLIKKSIVVFFGITPLFIDDKSALALLILQKVRLL